MYVLMLCLDRRALGCTLGDQGWSLRAAVHVRDPLSLGVPVRRGGEVTSPPLVFWHRPCVCERCVLALKGGGVCPRADALWREAAAPTERRGGDGAGVTRARCCRQIFRLGRVVLWDSGGS